MRCTGTVTSPKGVGPTDRHSQPKRTAAEAARPLRKPPASGLGTSFRRCQLAVVTISTAVAAIAIVAVIIAKAARMLPSFVLPMLVPYILLLPLPRFVLLVLQVPLPLFAVTLGRAIAVAVIGIRTIITLVRLAKLYPGVHLLRLCRNGASQDYRSGHHCNRHR